MKKTLILFSLFTALTSSAYAENWTENVNLKKAAVVVVAEVVCHMPREETSVWTRLYMRQAVAETGMPTDVLILITQTHAHKILNYIRENGTEGTFCQNAYAANW